LFPMLTPPCLSGAAVTRSLQFAGAALLDLML
jgi:hypothetical protein